MFQDQYYSFSLEEFAEILGVPCEGACVFTDKWALYELANGLPGDGPYQTFLPSLDDIITLVRVDREGPVTRVRHKKEIDVIEYQVLTREIDPTFKDIETILRENVFGLRSLVALDLGSTRFIVIILKQHVGNVKRRLMLRFLKGATASKTQEKVTAAVELTERYRMQQAKESLCCSYIINVAKSIVSAAKRKPRRDCGTRKGRTSTSSTPAFGEPSSYHPTNDVEDVDHNEGSRNTSLHTIDHEIGTRNEELEWSRFVTAAKQAKDRHNVNFDQLYAFLTMRRMLMKFEKCDNDIRIHLP
ncbi:hypothetical protein Tco_0414072 [Tanacetum coccineum]